MPSERNGRVAGLVLAAGLSSRMGTNKLLINLGSETVVHRAARQAVEAGLSPVIVVLGFEGDTVAKALEGVIVECVVNPDYASGMHASIRAGIAKVPRDCDAALVILADMPLVTSQMLAETIARFRTSRAPLVLSSYGGTQAPPTLFSRVLFSELVAADEQGGVGRRVVHAHRSEAATMHWPAARLADLDCSEDIERLSALFPEPSS